MKIGIIGAGNVGGTLAMRILEKGLGEAVLIDIAKNIAEGKALDLNEGAAAAGYEPRISGTDDYKCLKGADIVAVTCGFPRTPGMTREELLTKNLDILCGVIPRITEASPKTIIIVITNPLDLMAYAAYRISNLPRERVIGMGGVLDGTRFAYFISERLDIPVKDINPMVIGPHSDSMVVLPGFTTVSGRPLTSMLKEEDIKRLIQRTKKGGAEVVNLLKSGSSLYASSAAILKIIESVAHDRGETLPCSFFLEGEYGIDGVSIGVPVKIGRDGVNEVVELKLEDKEYKMLRQSAEDLKGKAKDIDARIKQKR